jgi:hypothetical protein
MNVRLVLESESKTQLEPTISPRVKVRRGTRVPQFPIHEVGMLVKGIGRLAKKQIVRHSK